MNSNHQNSNTTILVIGTLPPPIGGTSVSLQHLTEVLNSRSDVDLKIINTSGLRDKKILVCLLKFCTALAKIARMSRYCDIISLHIGLQALPILSPFVFALSLFYKKPLVIRRFGGNDHSELWWPFFRIVDPILRHVSFYLVQTKAQVESAFACGFKNVAWFPTSRPCVFDGYPIVKGTKCRRFVFLSQVKLSKGIPEIISAAQVLPDDFIVDIYGPFYDGLNEKFFSGTRVSYRGQVEPEKVPDVLKEYDALLLPTYYSGEGYPGVILEAFSLGMPVITTRWKSIPEIVDEKCGILIAPRDPSALTEAILELGCNQDLYNKLSVGATERHRSFSLEFWADKFVMFCKQAIIDYQMK